MALPSPPFALLDDARPGGAGARLYANPVDVVSGPLADVPAMLTRLRAAQSAGLHAVGYIHYEASAAIEPRSLPDLAAGADPRMWFGLFRDWRAIAAEEVPALFPESAGAWAGAPEPWITRAEYGAKFARVAEAIRAGDIYQANLSFRASVPVAGAPAALYGLLRERARAGHGALIATGDHWVLSFSPELFFALDGGRLTARPMKGTAPRGRDAQEDARLAAALRSDAKQRAENLMIVDLMRNDLARVARAGSVAVPELFHVERYPTVQQMVSSVTADLAEERDAIDALAALFPCGSITGAPKLRAMALLSQIEGAPRDVYTGAIGRLDADGNAAFGVAIRTLALADGADTAVLGLGSGVVADSEVDAEWHECLAKGAFVTAGERGFDLIETMAFDPDAGIALLERHLARLKASADRFGFAFDRHAARNDLQAATFRLRVASRVRLALARSGAMAIGLAPLPPSPAAPVRVSVVPRPVPREDFRLRHKTTRRGFYDAARCASGAFEVLFTDAEGYLTEGSFTSLFVPRGDVLVTPPLRRGLLPGVLRGALLDSGRAVEGDLRPEDLAGGFFIGNALRGLVAAVTVAEAAAAAV